MVLYLPHIEKTKIARSKIEQEKKIVRRCDLVVCDSSNGLEYACEKAGIDANDFSTKMLIELDLKAPKIMHDMFRALCKAVDNNNRLTRDIQVVGFTYFFRMYSGHEKKNTQN